MHIKRFMIYGGTTGLTIGFTLEGVIRLGKKRKLSLRYNCLF